MGSYEPGGRRFYVALRPIKVQGLTIRPGDPVLVLIDGSWILRTYEGWIEGQGAFMERPAALSTAPRHDRGPFPLENLKHPNFLEGFTKEIDGAQ